MLRWDLQIDTRKSFTLFEACPEPRCRDPHSVPPPQFPRSGPCPKCNDLHGRTTTFTSLEGLRAYVNDPSPPWPGSSLK
jgi:hypothetical protein